MSTPRILHIASWYPSFAHPTLGNFVEQHIRAIAPHTHSQVLHAAPFGKCELSHTRENNHSVTRVYFKKKWPLLSVLMAYRKGYKALKKEGFEAELIHLHVVWPAGLFCIMLRKKFIITEHYTGYHPHSPTQLKGIMKWLSKLIIQKAEAVYPVSWHLAKAIQKWHPQGKYQKISNAVNTDIFSYADPQIADSKAFRFLHISSLTNSTKNISGLLRAFAAAQQQLSQIELYIGGDGDLSFLKAEIARAQIPTGNVHTLGTQTSQEVSALMQQCHGFVLFSRIENQPVVLLESLCCGRPVIATGVGGIAEDVNPENGILIGSEDEEALKDALLRVAQNYNYFNLRQIAQKAQQLYSMHTVGMAYKEAYQQILRP